MYTSYGLVHVLLLPLSIGLHCCVTYGVEVHSRSLRVLKMLTLLNKSKVTGSQWYEMITCWLTPDDPLTYIKYFLKTNIIAHRNQPGIFEAS